MGKQDALYFGGDYSPDQWDGATLKRDLTLFCQAGINMVTLPVFSWAKLEPAEGVYDFGWLDRLMDTFHSHGLRVCLATPTAAQPAWMSAKYPDMLPVDAAGRRRTHGMRINFCVNNEKYRERAAAIAGEMARRYGRHPALAVWHIANEYRTYCYCDTCRRRFQQWLENQYGSVEILNERWNTAFWGRTVYRFDEIALPGELNDGVDKDSAARLDYLRFMTDSTLECYMGERQAIRRHSPDIPVTTNMSGHIHMLNHRKLAPHMDVVGWDNYPEPGEDPARVAFRHDIMRGLKNGQPFFLMEQSPNQQNWQPYSKLKKPGEVRRLSYQAMAHGADACLFFQLRQSAGGPEKFHGAVITHSGGAHTRVFKETAALGAELKQLGDVFIGGESRADVGLLFDWESWWALELAGGPSRDMHYFDTAAAYYRAFHRRHIPVDVLACDADMDAYRILLAPALYMLRPGVADRLKAFVRRGGVLVATTMTGIADENDRCVFGEYPGPLREVFGVAVEETDALLPEEANRLVPAAGGPAGQTCACHIQCDILRLEGAQAQRVYGNDFYAGTPCVTRHRYGDGAAYYVGTIPEPAYLDDLANTLCAETGVRPLFEADAAVELTMRVSGPNRVLFAINHGDAEADVDFASHRLCNLLSGEWVTGRCRIRGGDVWVLREHLTGEEAIG